MDNKVVFNELAATWDERCKHDFVKIQQIINLSGIKPQAKILDVGTGTGILINFLLKKHPFKITALDYAEKMIECAKKKYQDPRIEFVTQDIMQHDEKEYDYIFLYSVYPHFEDKEQLMRHLAFKLKTGGKLIIAHSQSKEKVNSIHQNRLFKNAILEAASITVTTMQDFFQVETVIDTDEMYYISATK